MARRPAFWPRLPALRSAGFLGGILCLALVGCRTPTRAPLELPIRVLLLGDSISIGYHEGVVTALGADGIVTRPMARDASGSVIGMENCEGTTRGVAEIERWLDSGDGPFDVIHFNFGLHDLKHVRAVDSASSGDPTDPRQAEPAVYAAQLAAIVTSLEATGARLVYATTTPVPPGPVRPARSPQDVELYNSIAREIMDAKGIPIDDLYAFALPRLSELQKPADVHFTAVGSAALAHQVAAAIRRTAGLQ